MKRAEELVPLSHDHHVTLELALRLRRATAADVEQLVPRALAHFRVETEPHFEAEEELLLPALSRHAGDHDADLVRTRADHAFLRERFRALDGGGPDATSARALNELGSRLSDHIHFEERGLFNRLESLLEPAELARIGRRLRVLRRI